MLILGDENQYDGKTPWATWTLIGLNVLIFVLQVQQGDRLTYGYSTVPPRDHGGSGLDRAAAGHGRDYGALC